MTGGLTVIKQIFPDKGEALLYFVFQNTISNDKNLKFLDSKLKGKVTEKIKALEFKGEEEQLVIFEGEKFYKYILLVGAGKASEFSTSKFKALLFSALSKFKDLKVKSVNLFYFSELGKDFFEIGKSIAISFCKAGYEFNKYKSKKKQVIKILNFQFLISNEFLISNFQLNQITEGINWGELLYEGVSLTRNLVNEPASHVHPEILEQEAFKIEKESKGKISVEVLDEDECRRLGMGAFLGVAQGSERKLKFIILKYQSETLRIGGQRSKSLKSICLIGKSITFDSGGLSLKPASAMEDMKIDMAGGATVLGVFKILALKKENINNNIYGILPACENMPSGKAIRPGDIVTALNGKTIEVLNTDAEGRLVLADALSYADKYLKTEVIIDVATLTGAAMAALGKDITASFSNNEQLHNAFLKTAKNAGEEVWAMPLFKKYLKDMKSDIADLKNIIGSHYGGAITAALFLSEFVSKKNWLHLDVAGPVFDKMATGWGVISLVDFIINY